MFCLWFNQNRISTIFHRNQFSTSNFSSLTEKNKTKIDCRVFYVPFQKLHSKPLCWLKIVFKPITELMGCGKLHIIISWRFHSLPTYTARRVAYQQSPVRRHCSLPCTDKRPTGVSRPFRVSEWVLRRYEPVICPNHSVNKHNFIRVDVTIHLSHCVQTFFVQYIDGTGFPEALHSNVTAPPFRAVIWPLDGTARTLGGTAKLIWN